MKYGGILAQIGCMAALCVAAVGCSDGGSSNEPVPAEESTETEEGDADPTTPDPTEGDGDGPTCTPKPDTPTFNEEVGAILSERCTLCHSNPPQFGAPFPLTSFAAATGSTAAGSSILDKIRVSVESGAMPPPSQPAMPDAERAAILAWADECAPEGPGDFTLPDGPQPGDLVPVPPPPPDSVKTSVRANGFAVPTSTDTYRCFPLTLDLDDDPTTSGELVEHIVRFDVEVDVAQVVHHLVLYSDDAGTIPDQPFECDGMPPGSTFMYAWAPGGQPLQFEPGQGFPVVDGQKIALQVHYNNAMGTPDVVDDSAVDIYLAPPRPVEVGMVATGPVAFSVPPLSEHSVASQCRPAQTTQLIAGMPHMHEIGTVFEAYIERSDGTTQTVVKVDNWSFDDQPFYSTPFTIEPEDRLVTRCTYQNESSDLVLSGEDTANEMCFGFFYHVPPIGEAFCDEVLDEDTEFEYAPGACAGDLPRTGLPTASGGVKLLDAVEPIDTNGDIEGTFALEAFEFLMPEYDTGLIGVVDPDASAFTSQMVISISDGEVTIDGDLVGVLGTESSAEVPYDASLSEVVAYEISDDDELVALRSTCEDTDMPFGGANLEVLDDGNVRGVAFFAYPALGLNLAFEVLLSPID